MADDWYERMNAEVEREERERSNVHSFRQRDEDAAAEGVTLDNFHAYMPMHNYIFAPTREMWPAGSVNARIPPVRSPRTARRRPSPPARGSTRTGRSSR